MILNDKLRSVLPSLGLPDERCGSARGSQLTPGERDLYRWILRYFATGSSPSTDEVGAAARSSGVDVAAAMRSSAGAGIPWRAAEQAPGFASLRDDMLDRLADAIEQHIDTDNLLRIVEHGPPPGRPFVPPGAL